jgi:hypothetical protein
MNAAHLTSELMWRAAALTAGLDVILIGVAAWLVPARRFERLKWPSAIAAGVFWLGMWTLAMWGPWWELAYRHIFPEWARWIVPPTYGVMFGAIGMGFWWLARRLPGPPAVAFCLLGGLVSLPGHLFGIHGRGMLEKVPVLQGVSVVSALVFGIFEFIVYWVVIVLAAAALGRAGWTSQSQQNAR